MRNPLPPYDPTTVQIISDSCFLDFPSSFFFIFLFYIIAMIKQFLNRKRVHLQVVLVAYFSSSSFFGLKMLLKQIN